MRSKLTPQQARFVVEYLIDLNATQAAIRAGYSEATANQQGPRLLVNVGVKQAIDELLDARTTRTLLNADYVINGFIEVYRRCKGVDEKNATRALENLAKHLNLLGDYGKGTDIKELKLINIIQNADSERKYHDRINSEADRSASLSH